jgi:hypothetical protein
MHDDSTLKFKGVWGKVEGVWEILKIVGKSGNYVGGKKYHKEDRR